MFFLYEDGRYLYGYRAELVLKPKRTKYKANKIWYTWEDLHREDIVAKRCKDRC